MAKRGALSPLRLSLGDKTGLSHQSFVKLGVDLLLRRNGYRLTATNAALEAFTMQVAQGKLTVDEMVDWFRTHSKVL